MADRSLRHRLTFDTHKLEPGEEIERIWVAGVGFSQEDNFRGRLGKYGGNLVLTNRRILFEPLQLAKFGGGLSGKQHAFLEGKEGVALSEITAVEPFSKKGPPRLKVSFGDRESVVLTVIEKRTTAIWNKDTSTRDEAIAAITGAAAA